MMMVPSGCVQVIVLCLISIGNQTGIMVAAMASMFVFLTSSCEYGIVIFDFRLELVLIGMTCRILKNLLDRVSQLYYPFSLPEHLKADNTAVDRVVALTPGSAITILENANEFAIKAGGIFLYKTTNQAYQLLEDKVLLKLDWAKNQMIKSSLKKTVAFADEGSSNSNTDKIMVQIDAMSLKMDAEYKELQTHAKKQNPNLMKMTYLCLVRKYLNSCKLFQSGRPSGFLPSNTQPNPKGHNNKTYQPPQAQNEHVNIVFIRSDKSYNPPVNPNDQQNDPENPINFDSDDEEDKEPTPQPKTQNPKPVKETPLPKPYKPNILYPQCLRKEKMEAQYGKFVDIIRVVRINVPLIDVLAGMPNYVKFLKELISNKHKIEQISADFLSDESSTMIQNKVPPKLEDP
nr:reverse transcriptase domain-containing protein [Tanacetum cinerariifolium]